MKTLDELAEVKRGKSRHRPRTAAALYGGPHPFIQTADIHASEFRILKCSQSYSDFGLAQSKKWKAGTLCITNAGENTGDCAILGFDACFPDSIIGITPLEGKADVRFLKYALDLLRPQLRTVTKGATQDNLSVAILLSFPFPAPDLPTQRKIAGILSAYDDLIENNLRRIKILEEMAQSLYREWFVHFRFPGHESARFTQSDIGRIPKGWDVKAMTEAVIVRPQISIPKGGDVRFVTMGGLSENSMLITEVESRDAPTGARFQNGDTLFARITPCLENGKTGYVEFLPSDESAACGSTEFIVLRSKTVCPQYVYLMARSDAFRDNAIKSMSGATGRQRVRDECFEQFFLAQPPEDLLARFESITRPQFELIHSLNRRNQNLRRTRDLLLPKLLSAEK
jgi:type I restriction enzyme S subunit